MTDCAEYMVEFALIINVVNDPLCRVQGKINYGVND